jgi:hypothetical protein
MEVHNEPTGSHHTQEKIMADTKNTKPALDLAALVPTDAEVPTMQRERKHRDNPFVAWLSESYSTETGKSVTVPAANVGELEYLIRRASDDLGIGARVVVQNSKGETLDKDARKNAKGNLTVLFAGKDRKTRRTAEQVAAESATA